MAAPRYNVFISFSGETSIVAAKALRDWLPRVVQTAKPFVSESDIEKGTRGLQEITQALEGIKVGIVCLTPDNLSSPWIHYESGALSKTIDDKTRLCTYLLCGLQPKDVEPPLGMFQHTKAEREETRKLVRAINKAVNDEPIAEATLDDVFEAMWPRLEANIKTLPRPREGSTPKRTVEEMVAEILEINRSEANRRKKLEWMDEFEPVMRSFLLLLQREAWGSQRGVLLSTLAGRSREQKGVVEPEFSHGGALDPADPPDSAR